MLRRIAVLCALAVLCACSVDDDIRYIEIVVEKKIVVEVPAKNTKPTADAGKSTIGFTWETFYLRAVASVDPDGDILAYQWSLDQRPPRSTAVIGNIYAPETTFVPDLPGKYLITVIVHDGRVYSNPATVTITVTATPFVVGEIVEIIGYPAGVIWIGDIAFEPDGGAFWALTGTSQSLPEWLRIDAETGAILSRTPNNEFFLNHGSEITIAGDELWATTFGASNGIPQAFISQVDPATGVILSQFPCPASTTGGYCEGLAWDGSKFWAGASDGKNIVGFDKAGKIISTIIDPWGTINSNLDLDWNHNQNTLLSVKNNYTAQINTATGELLNNSEVPIGKPGGWDGELFWVPDNFSQTIKGIYIGQ